MKKCDNCSNMNYPGVPNCRICNSTKFTFINVRQPNKLKPLKLQKI